MIHIYNLVLVVKYIMENKFNINNDIRQLFLEEVKLQWKVVNIANNIKDTIDYSMNRSITRQWHEARRNYVTHSNDSLLMERINKNWYNNTFYKSLLFNE